MESFVWNKKDIKKIQKFNKMKCPRKTLFQHTVPPAPIFRPSYGPSEAGNDWHCIIQMCSVYVVPHPIYLMQPKSSANRVY